MALLSRGAAQLADYPLMPMSWNRGSGALDLDQRRTALAMLRDGMSQQAVADDMGVTKNTVAGLWARQGDGVARVEPTTLFERCATLHDRLDAVLAETRGIGHVPPPPEPKRRHR